MKKAAVIFMVLLFFLAVVLGCAPSEDNQTKELDKEEWPVSDYVSDQATPEAEDAGPMSEEVIFEEQGEQTEGE